ncbi:MAG: GNAT family N-acetyltransferase, partial [Lachnospiraceae bacterium]|nr:GNAT family N-acetyltransferase [Lachnospiraceae bacterium]
GVKYVLEGEGEFDPEYFDEDYLEKIYRRLLRIPWDILETDRCVIRETTVSDLDAFYEIYSDPGITRFMEDLMERSEEEKYTENYRDLIYGIYGHGIWTVILRETGEVIGRAGLDERAGFTTPELGFMIGTKWQRRGLALEVCEGILRWAAEEGMDNVMSLTEKENTASVSLLEKLGFSAEDTVKIAGAELVRYLKTL